MVRPIDLQDNLSKTQAAERMNQIQKQQGEMGQRQVADALKEKTSAEAEKAKATEKTDMVIIRKEQEKESRNRKGKREKNGKRDEADNESSDHLDLKG